jgi:hypothetical protein
MQSCSVSRCPIDFNVRRQTLLAFLLQHVSQNVYYPGINVIRPAVGTFRWSDTLL